MADEDQLMQLLVQKVSPQFVEAASIEMTLAYVDYSKSRVVAILTCLHLK
jgi:hypothetical protein